MAADAFPLDNAVNKADEKILHPENRKLNEKMTNPFLVISKTFSVILGKYLCNAFTTKQGKQKYKYGNPRYKAETNTDSLF